MPVLYYNWKPSTSFGITLFGLNVCMKLQQQPSSFCVYILHLLKTAYVEKNTFADVLNYI